MQVSKRNVASPMRLFSQQKQTHLRLKNASKVVTVAKSLAPASMRLSVLQKTFELF